MQLATSGDHELAVDKALHRFHGLHPDFEGLGTPCIHPKGGPLTTPQASRDATDRSVAPTNVAFDAGLRPPPFPDEAANLLPGPLAATRTGLPPAGDDELTTKDQLHTTTSSLLGARKIWASDAVYAAP
jgi:hypothetical protein